MDEIVSLPLALLDFLPVICFMIGGWYLSRTAVQLFSHHARNAALIGTALVVMGGAFRAATKLASAVGLGNLNQLGDIHFILQAPGFLILLVSAVSILRAAGRPVPKSNPLLALAVWKIPLIILMALAGTALHGILASIALGRKARVAAASFALALGCLLAMGVAARGEQTIAMQWIEESINTLGQLGFALGSFLLYKNFAAQVSRPQLSQVEIYPITTRRNA